jgi:hypothetical protein
MSKLRSLFFHAWCIPSSLVACLVFSAPGCGEKTTIGQVVPNPDGGTGGDGGSAAAPADGAAGASTGGDSGNSAGGTSGEAGSAGATTADAGTKTACGLPRPSPKSNPTAAEQERSGLIRTLCERLLEIGCLDSFDRSTGQISQEAKDCPPDQRITACELDLLYSYMLKVSPACDAEWHTMIRCEIAAENDAERCLVLDPSDTTNELSVQLTRCSRERQALALCGVAHVNGETIQGARAECFAGPKDPTTCWAGCSVRVPGTIEKNYFSTECSAPPGLPLFCECYVNGTVIYEVGPNAGKPFSASSCREVGQLMADGECVDRLDCCVQWPAPDGSKSCACMANDQIGAPSCEAAAQAAGGTVIDICPQYKQRYDPGFCWPPWDAKCQPSP